MARLSRLSSRHESSYRGSHCRLGQMPASGDSHQRRYRHFPRHQRRVDRVANRDPRAARLHVPLGELMYVAAARALACAGVDGRRDRADRRRHHELRRPGANVASGIQRRIGADGCAAMDVNTACTSFLYSLSTATAMIRTGVVNNALVHRRRGHLAVHGLERPQCRRVVR